MNKNFDKNTTKQKRSENTRLKILHAGFALFNKKGYHATNTTEIAARAGISVGGLYGRYQNKYQIFFDAYDEFFSSKLTPLLDVLKSATSTDYEIFVNRLIDTYITLYEDYGRAIKELHNMMSNDSEISEHFIQQENILINQFHNELSGRTVTIETIYIIYFLINSTAMEYVNHIHNLVNPDMLVKRTKQTIIQLLKNSN